jgi:plasmid stabilization system protein ParE
MSDFVLTPAAQADVLRIIDFLEGDNPSAILRSSMPSTKQCNSSPKIR